MPAVLFILFLYFEPTWAIRHRCGNEVRFVDLTPETRPPLSEWDYRRIFDLPDNELCLKNTPSRYKNAPGFRELAYDPDRKLITPGSIREAMAILELAFQFLIPSPVTRAPAGSRADFFDGQGMPYDVKSYSSRRTSRGIKLDPHLVGSWLIEKLRGPVKNSVTGRFTPMRVILDQTHLNLEDRAKLDAYLETHLRAEEQNRIIRMTLPEPIWTQRP